MYGVGCRGRRGCKVNGGCNVNGGCQVNGGCREGATGEGRRWKGDGMVKIGQARRDMMMVMKFTLIERVENENAYP